MKYNDSLNEINTHKSTFREKIKELTEGNNDL